MKIALFGYGKMGKAIEKIAESRGHEIVLRIDSGYEGIDFSKVEVAIDFSLPDAAFNNISKCLKSGIPIISGTTGWLDHYEEAVALCKKNSGAFLYASNFSLGVNIFFKLNEVFAKLMSVQKQYTAEIEETHHIHKLDAPSGTAITLAKGIIENSDYKNYTLDRPQPGELSVVSHRINEVPGTHKISYKSPEDTITIQHEAHSRQGFALGAIIAAEWILGKTGIFTMKDVLNID